MVFPEIDNPEKLAKPLKNAGQGVHFFSKGAGYRTVALLKLNFSTKDKLTDTQDRLPLFLKYFSSLQQVGSSSNYQYALGRSALSKPVTEVYFFFFGAAGSSIVSS